MTTLDAILLGSGINLVGCFLAAVFLYHTRPGRRFYEWLTGQPL